MKAITELRSAISAELEEITKHYRGILDHLDALALVFEKQVVLNQIQDELHVAEVIPDEPPRRKRNKKNNVAAQVRAILMEEPMGCHFDLRYIVQQFRQGKRNRNPSVGAVRLALRQLVKRHNLKVDDSQGPRHLLQYTLIGKNGLEQ